jgi:small conductance mechanosensitive channel
MQFDAESLAALASTLVTTWGLRVVGAIAVLIIGRMAARWLRGLTKRALERGKTEPTLIPFLSGFVYSLAIAFVVIAVLGLFGIPTASFVAVLGAAGLAIGLAMQGTFSNFAAGVMLLVFRPFKMGDVVEVAGSLGKVQEIGIFTTTMNTPDNIQVIVPNAQIFGQVIKNVTGNDTRRVDLIMGVSYEDDLSVAKQTIERVVAAHPMVLEDPAPVVAVAELADSSVNFVVRPWCKTDDYFTVRWEVTRQLKEELEAAGCSIPFPQRDVHLFPAEQSAA